MLSGPDQARGWRRLGTDAQHGQSNRCAPACCPLRTQLWANHPGVLTGSLGLPGLTYPDTASMIRGAAPPAVRGFQSPLHMDLSGLDFFFLNIN